MWDMYATFEDMISGSGQRDERAKATLLALSSTSSSSSLNTSLLGGGKKLIDNIGTSSLSSSTGNTVNQEVDNVINSCSSENSANDSPGSELDEKMTSRKSMTMETINSQQQIDEEANSVNLTESLSSQSTLTPTSLILPSDEETIKSSDNNGNDNGTLTNNSSSDKCDRQFRPIPTSKGKLLHKRQSAIDKLVEKPVATTNLGGYQSDSGSNSSLANPLLDTISCLTSSDPYSDSDDYDVARNKVIHQRARRRCRRMLSDRSLRCSPNHLHSCCSSDADSIGYAGSNSIDSGYKSLCPTPEVPESISNLLPYKVTELTTIGDKVPVHSTTTTAKMLDNSVAQSNSSSSLSAFQRLSNLNSRNQPHLPYSSMNQSPSQVSSLSIKSRDNSQILTLNRGDHPIASSSSSSSISGSYSSRGGASVSSRLKGQSTEAHLEHLLTLRQSLISAIQKCEPSTPTDSRVASPVISSRSTSPASTVIPRTVTNLKIKPSASQSSYSGVSYSSSTSSTTFDSNQILHQSSIHRTGCSSPTTIKPGGTRFSPEPWYSQQNYSPSPSQQHHTNYYSQSQYSPTVNSSRFSRTVNSSHLTIPDNHQSPVSMTSSTSLSMESNLITPTQSSDMMGYKQQQNYSSSTLSSSSVPFNTNKSVRFEEVMVRSLKNYPSSNDLIMSLNCNTIETNDYPTTTPPPPTELSTERSILSTLSNSSPPSIVASGLENTAVDCINDSGSSSNSLSSNSFNGNTTTTTNSNTDCSNNNSNNNINGHISIGANNSANYNGISSSSSSSTGTFSTKSILKDPICANLRTSIESEKFNAAQSLENEIDSLLYGKHFTDSIFLSTNQHLENATINDSQYSSSTIPKESTGLYHQQSTADDPLNIAYVKMIEEKYRTANRTKIQDHDDTFTSHLIDNNASNTNETIDSTRTIDEVNVTSNYQRKSPSNYIVNHQGTNRFDSQRVPVYHQHPSHYRQYQKQQQLRNNNSLSAENVDSSLDSLSKSKISEMAKCMLGILDEIEMKNSIENRLPQLDPAVRLREKVNYSPRIKDRSRPNSAEFRGSLEVNPGHLVNNMETASESSYHSLPEYHIYEEVAYDYMMREHQNRPVSPQVTITNTRKERPTVRRILPPNPSGSMTMLNNLRFSGNSSSTSSSVYRSSLKDLFNKPFDGNNNHRLSSTTNGQDAAHLSRASGRYETELKCFRSSSSSPLSSSRTSTSTLNNQTAINNSNDSSNWRSWGRVTEQPKQRGNLYSLFTDPDQRINIGRSLRKDHWNYNQQPTIDMEMYNQMDQVSTISSEYGFKNN